MPKRPLLAALVALCVASAAPVSAAEPSLEAQIQSATGISRVVDADLVALARKRAAEASANPVHRYLWELNNGKWASWGEVLAWSTYSEAELFSRAVEGWRNSPGHWSVLTDRSYEAIGCGVYWGAYNGKYRWTLACVLANAKAAPAPTPAPAPEPTPAPGVSPDPVVSPPAKHPPIVEIPDTAMGPRR